MKYAISTAGLALIQEFEGFRADPAQLPDGNWVVGHGHVRIGQPGAEVSQTEAAGLLALDLAPIERLVNGAVTQPLTQSQFDALVSFAFSVGEAAFRKCQVLRHANSGNFVAAACAMDAWRKSDVAGELEVVGALVRRRAAEKALFLSDLPHDSAPSALMRAKLDHAASILGAPVKLSAAPFVGSAPVAKPKAKAAKRLTEILMSEPATETLLLTQVVPDDFVEEDLIVTGHAKPVSRKVDEIVGADAPTAVRVFEWPRFNLSRSVESVGLIALMVFGLGLIGAGASIVFGGGDDLVGMAGAFALITPGLAASFIAAFGIWRGPELQPVKA